MKQVGQRKPYPPSPPPLPPVREVILPPSGAVNVDGGPPVSSDVLAPPVAWPWLWATITRTA